MSEEKPVGLYTINCPECQAVHRWFSGTRDQRCSQCKKIELLKKCLLQAQDAAIDLASKNAQLGTALEFYASPDSYLLVEDATKRIIGILERDPGARAREALGEKP